MSPNRAPRRAVTGLGRVESGPSLRPPSPGVSFLLLTSPACAQGMDRRPWVPCGHSET